MKRFIFRSGDITANLAADRMVETEYGMVIAYKGDDVVAVVNEKFADFVYVSDDGKDK